jgi:homoserine O-acetyltransferase/O-succinyltransferase
MLQKITDEHTYGTIFVGDIQLESGEVLKDTLASYEMVGNKSGPVILIFHALTGNERTYGTDDHPGWWRGMVGPNLYIDTNQYLVITFNVLGGCSGSTGPTSINPDTGKEYRTQFPFFTIRDMVHFQKKALAQLGIHHVKAVIGGSLGGMQALEWGVLYPDTVEHVIALAVTPYLSDYGIAFNRIGIEAILHDPNWKNGYYENASDVNGLSIAHMVGMVTYRTGELFEERFQREIRHQELHQPPYYQVESYLHYQGKKLLHRFDPNSYLYLLHAMNSHDIGRDRGNLEEVFKQYQPKLTSICFQGDLLYKGEVMEKYMPYVHDGNYVEVPTKFGHDGFLVEFDQWGPMIQRALTD